MPLRQDLARLPGPVWVVAAGSFVNRFCGFVVPFLVLYLAHHGYSAGQAAMAVSAYAAGKIAAGLAGRLPNHRHPRRPDHDPRPAPPTDLDRAPGPAGSATAEVRAGTRTHGLSAPDRYRIL